MKKKCRICFIALIIGVMFSCTSCDSKKTEVSEDTIMTEEKTQETQKITELHEVEEETTNKLEVYEDYVVRLNEVNVYKENDITSEVINNCYKNSILQVTSVNDINWKKVKFSDNTIGYVQSADIEPFSGDLMVYKEYQVADYSKKYAYITVDSGNVRTLPDLTGEIVGTMKQGESFEILAVTNNNWNIINYNNSYCYVSSEILKYLTKEEFNAYQVKLKKGEFNDVNMVLIGKYTTYYTPGDNRGFNLEKAAGVVDSLVIPSKSVFNWFRDVGSCGQEEGYMVSTEISNGQYVKGYGGGICQVSSTLCAAILTATEGEFEFLSRKSHSKAQKYIPHELDATVSYPTVNFIVRNNNAYNIMIKTNCNDGNITVEVYKLN